MDYGALDGSPTGSVVRMSAAMDDDAATAAAQATTTASGASRPRTTHRVGGGNAPSGHVDAQSHFFSGASQTMVRQDLDNDPTHLSADDRNAAMNEEPMHGTEALHAVCCKKLSLTLLMILTGMYCGINFFTGPVTYVVSARIEAFSDALEELQKNSTTFAPTDINASTTTPPAWFQEGDRRGQNRRLLALLADDPVTTTRTPTPAPPTSKISQISQGEFNSALNLGTATGSFISGYAAFMEEGMRNVQKYACLLGVFSCICSFLVTYSQDMKGAQICCFLLTGVTCGSFIVIMPLYALRRWNDDTHDDEDEGTSNDDTTARLNEKPSTRRRIFRRDVVYSRVSDLCTMLFQLSITIGVLCIVLLGEYVLRQTAIPEEFLLENQTSVEKHLTTMIHDARINLAALYFLPASVALVATCIVLRCHRSHSDTNGTYDRVKATQGWKARLLIGVLMAYLQQGTGITDNLDFNGLPFNVSTLQELHEHKPTLGDAAFIVFPLNLVVTAIALLGYCYFQKIRLMQMFAASAFATAVITLLDGIFLFVYRYDLKATTNDMKKIVVTVLFVVCFELGMGPTFYVLAHRIFGDDPDLDPALCGACAASSGQSASDDDDDEERNRRRDVAPSRVAASTDRPSGPAALSREGSSSALVSSSQVPGSQLHESSATAVGGDRVPGSGRITGRGGSDYQPSFPPNEPAPTSSFSSGKDDDDDDMLVKTTAFLSACVNAVAQFVSLLFTLAYPTFLHDTTTWWIPIVIVGVVAVVVATVVLVTMRRAIFGCGEVRSNVIKRGTR